MEQNKYTIRAINIQLNADKKLALKNYWMNRYYLAKQILDDKVYKVLNSGERQETKTALINKIVADYKVICDDYFNKSQLEFKEWERLTEHLASINAQVNTDAIQ